MQDLAVYVIVALAVTYMVRYCWLAVKGQGGCGNCKSKGCASKAKPTEPQLVQIDLNGSFRK